MAATYSIPSKDLSDAWNSLSNFVHKGWRPIKKEGGEFVDALNRNVYAPAVQFAAEKVGFIFNEFVAKCCSQDAEAFPLRKHTAQALTFDLLSLSLSMNAIGFLLGSLSLGGLLFFGGLKLAAMVAIQTDRSTSGQTPNENLLEVCGAPIFKNVSVSGLKSLAGGVVSKVTSLLVS